MSIALNQLSQILDLVGQLDDSSGSNTPRERFRDFLERNVVEIGQIRDLIEECLKTPGDRLPLSFSVSPNCQSLEGLATNRETSA